MRYFKRIVTSHQTKLGNRYERIAYFNGEVDISFGGILFRNVTVEEEDTFYFEF